ncbi:hypothetical protein PVA45_04380 [Entomospira entomophila]|uniref:PEGA domain-containing protein n=1 Tax=Entomospira entomophila TaxID=2719988 RepID=A0A968GE33_9SPIO|nr:hypothetical protein [Entomospira entomophilus]NIZ40744.1 hypothetical protein [Entomospira entomophilus]WDI34957.1 hypothetical protein PVA45_04380 [Entomospira entomophilus]
MALLLFMLCFVVLPVFSQTKLQTLEAYHIHVAKLDGSSPRESNFMQSLLYELYDLPDHTVSRPELFFLNYRAREEQLYFLQRELTQLEERFQKFDEEKYPNLKARTEIKRAIKRKKREIHQFVQKPPRYSIPEILSIQIHQQPVITRNSILEMPTNEEKPWAIMGSNFWIFGDLLEVDSKTTFLHLTGYDVWKQEEITLYRGSFLWNQRNEIIQQAIDTVRSQLLGRDWSAIMVKDLPSDNFLIQWQDPLGVPRTPALQQRSFSNLTLAEGRLRIYVAGYQRQSIFLDLKPNYRHHVSFYAVESSDDDRFIQVNVPQADLFLDGLYVGSAPKTITARAGQILSVVDRSSSGRAPIIYEIKEDDREINLKFGISLSEHQKIIKKAQRTFYIWAGVFILSLVLPIVFYNLYLDYKQKSERYYMLGLHNEYYAAYRMSTLYGYSAIGTGVFSAGLLGVTIYQLYRYVHVSANPPIAVEEDQQNEEVNDQEA